LNIIERGLINKQARVFGLSPRYLAKCAPTDETRHLSRKNQNRSKYNSDGTINEVKMDKQLKLFTDFTEYADEEEL